MNPRDKKVVSVLVIGSAILVWRVYAIVAEYMPASAQAMIPNEPEAVAVEPPTTVDPFAAVWDKQRSLEERPWGRDPFAMPEGFNTITEAPRVDSDVDDKPPPAPRLGFSGVSRSGNTYRAIIKAGIVKVGDPVDGGFTVRAIDPRSVTVGRGRWNFVYQIGSEQPTAQPSGERP